MPNSHIWVHWGESIPTIWLFPSHVVRRKLNLIIVPRGEPIIWLFPDLKEAALIMIILIGSRVERVLVVLVLIRIVVDKLAKIESLRISFMVFQTLVL